MKSSLPLICLTFTLTWAACSTDRYYAHSGQADRLFDSIADCAKNEDPSQFRTKCGKRYQDSEFSVRVDSIRTLGVNYITLFGEMGNPNKLINCSLRGKYRAEIEKLAKGEIVTLTATPSSVSFGDVTFIHFDECELQEHH